MRVIIDYREKDMLSRCESLVGAEGLGETISISSEALPVGDAVIQDDDGREVLIVERKSISDLASSINDGRYKEQSLRLQCVALANHNVIYLVEGNLEGYKPRWGRIDRTALYSSLVTLNYYKGFSVVRSSSVGESAEYVIRYASKIHRCKSLDPFYGEKQATGNTTEGDAYSSVVKRVKKDNINPTNIHHIWLSQLPHVSDAAARTILEEHKTVWGLRDRLIEDPCCLDAVQMQTTTGKTRRIGKNVVDIIKTHLA